MLNTQSVPLGKTAEGGARAGGRGGRSQHWLGWLSLPVGLAILLALWAGLSQLYPPFILPGPVDVAARFAQALTDGTLARHLSVTLVEALLGFALGFVVAVILGYGIAKQPLVERIISPYVVASQAVPIVALAPLLILWFGHGLASKVLVCALVVFFPILVNTVVALRSVDPQSRELMRSLNASSWQTFAKLELPASLPIMFGGLRMGVTLCVIGAVVGEFVGADTGLGALVNLSRGMFDTALMFVALFTLIALAMSLYLMVTLVERLVTRP
ncbi:MAG: ABC transporter permease [Anaerolineae bacterium]